MTVVYCPIFHVKWECRVPFSLTQACTYACAHTNAYTLIHTDVHTHTHAHTHTPLKNSGDRHTVKKTDTLETAFEQTRLKGGFAQKRKLKQSGGVHKANRFMPDAPV